MKISKKKSIGGLLPVLMFSLLLCSCGKSADTDENAFSTLYIEKNGKIESKIVEDFDETYYYEDELKDMIDKEVFDYNKNVNDENITFKSCEKDENAIIVKMVYKTADDYAAFNDEVLFVGTVQEAYQAGYDLDLKLEDADDSQMIGKNDILSMGDKPIIISNENIRISCYKKIKYRSKDINLVSAKEADLPATDSYNILILE